MINICGSIIGFILITRLPGSLGLPESSILKNELIQPTFPSNYVAEGIITIINTSIRQPFQIWYLVDASSSLRRQDFFNGMIKTLRVSNGNQNITHYEYFPITTSTSKNQQYCVQNTEPNATLENMIPELSSFQFCGNENIRGVWTEKWCNQTNLKNETVFIKYQASSNDPNQKIPIPIRVTKNSHRFDQQIDFTVFRDEKPNLEFISSLLRNTSQCKDMANFYHQFVETRANAIRLYGDHKKVFELRPKQYENLPDHFDWRDEGVVSEVKNQGEEGPCWSFAVTGQLESVYFIHTNKTKSLQLSQQALLDCNWEFGNLGNFGGNQEYAFEWMIKYGGIPRDEDYGPYLGKSGYCHMQNMNLFAPITGYGHVPKRNSTLIKAALKHFGPLTVVIDAYTTDFLNYSDGIFKDPTCGTEDNKMNHALLLVGYGKQNNTEYWILKNSWGKKWGKRGYVTIAMENNVCGVMNNPTYVTF